VIPPALSLLSPRVTFYYGLGWLEVTVRYRANVESVVATATLATMRGRRIWSGRTRDSFIQVGRVETTDITWYRLRRVAKRMRLTVTVVGGGAAARLTRIVRAPGFNDV
jgi:hypothetical protein